MFYSLRKRLQSAGLLTSYPARSYGFLCLPLQPELSRRALWAGLNLIFRQDELLSLAPPQATVRSVATAVDEIGTTAGRERCTRRRARSIKNPLGFRMLFRKCGRTSTTKAPSVTPRSSKVSRIRCSVCSVKI